MPRVLSLCGLILLAGCASSPRQLDDDGLPVTDGRGGGGGHGGGNQSIWSEVLRTAMQTGVGMIHR